MWLSAIALAARPQRPASQDDATWGAKLKEPHIEGGMSIFSPVDPLTTRMSHGQGINTRDLPLARFPGHQQTFSPTVTTVRDRYQAGLPAEKIGRSFACGGRSAVPRFALAARMQKRAGRCCTVLQMCVDLATNPRRVCELDRGFGRTR